MFDRDCVNCRSIFRLRIVTIYGSDKVSIQEYDTALDDFAAAQRERLYANAHKGLWHDCPDHFLVNKLAEELVELLIEMGMPPRYLIWSLENELAQREHPDMAMILPDIERVRREAADVANVLMMYTDPKRIYPEKGKEYK
jgi:hypothetical protein